MTNIFLSGRFVWFEYSSKDLPKSQGFFGELFNWSTQSVPMEKGAYTMIASGDATIGGYAMPTSMKGAPDAWCLSLLQVADAAASAKQVAKRGGKVLQEPIDIKVGIMAVVADPMGGVFALWQPTNRAPGGDYRQQPGSFCWNELYTNDGADRGVPRHLRQLQRDGAADLLADDEVQLRGVREQAHHVMKIRVHEIQIDRRAVVLRVRRAQLAGARHVRDEQQNQRGTHRAMIA